MRSRFGLGEALAFIGALAMIVSVFLFWMKGAGAASPIQGIDDPALFFPLRLLFLVGLLCFSAFAARVRGLLPALAFIGLGFAGLALIGNFAYDYFAEAHREVGNLREGFYIAGIGSLLVFVSGFLKFR